MAGVKNPLSYLDLDRANPTAVILEKTFRDAVEYKKEIDDGFDAIVLTEPTLASKDADAVLNNIASRDEDKNSSSRSTYCCMVRILGDDSPHNFLPDPFDFYLTDDEECQKRYSNLLQMHTMLTLSKISNADRPEKGDIVRLKLAKNQRSFSTKFAKDYNGIKIKKNAAPPELRRKAEKLEENAKKPFKKGKIKKKIVTPQKTGTIEYSGPLLIRRSDGLLTIGRWNVGVTPPNFWKDFIKRFQNYVSNAYPELGLDTKTNGATRDLASAAKTNNAARASGSKHGAALALDLKINTQLYGNYKGYKQTNPKLATDKKLTNIIIDFMNLPEQENLIWGGTFGGGARKKNQLATGRGVTEFHHFEFKDSYMPVLFSKFEDDLNILGFTSSQMTSTKELAKLYVTLLNSKPLRVASASSRDVGSKDHKG